jgi:hypothetical protein
MSTVHWPAGHEPARAAIHEVNSGRSVATPELVWAWLIRPDLWHTYYANVRDVRHIAGPWPEIGLGSHFSWVTFRAPGDHQGHRVRALRAPRLDRLGPRLTRPSRLDPPT